MDIFGRRRYSEKKEEEDNAREESSDRPDVLGREDEDEERLSDLAPEDDDDGEDFDEDEVNDLEERELQWKDPSTKNAVPPHSLTVTHVNHTQDLLRVQHLSAVSAEDQSTEEWLQTHSIEFQKLSLKDLVDKGKIGNPQPDTVDGKVKQCIQFEAYDVNEFEYKLHVAIETYTKRIKWLLQGSRRVFGNIKGDKVAVVIDTSDANCGFGRLTTFQESLIHLLDEQISKKKCLYLLSFGSEVDSLWKVPRDVNDRIIEEGKEWVMRLQAGGGCNLLKAMKMVMNLPDVDSVCLVLGSVPDQSAEVLSDYIHQMAVGRDIPLHAVAYDCNNHMTNITLRNLAESSKGRYHCYTATCEEQIYTSTDISLILKEIKKTQDIINKIKEMRQGMMGTALVSIMNEINTEVSKLPQSRFLPRPPGHDQPLRIETPKFQPRSSVDWISQHGLKAKRLDLYQVLAPNAYSYKEEFIPVIRKAVQSQVHEKSMVQFTWHDGSVKNVHVDLTQLFEYQKQLGAAVNLFERRIDWLSTSSRRIFGTVVEKNVVFLIDLSVSNVKYLVHIQHSLRILMEQQVANKEYFNIIGFGSTAKAWRPTMVKPTPENMQDAWRWILDMQCGGSRNFLQAFKMAVENDEEIKHGIHVQGIYLFTSGVPDQPQDVAVSYVEEASSGKSLKLHSILFNVDDYDSNGAIPSRYANITRTAECLRNMAHASRGRFHWFRETGIIESDDIQSITAEIDKSVNFSRKCAILVESVKKKYQRKYPEYEREELQALPTYQRTKPLPGPRPSSAKMSVSGKDRTRALGWRPSSASQAKEKVPVPPGSSKLYKPSSARDPMQRVRPLGRVTTSSFFLEEKNFVTGQNVGSVIKKYPGSKSVRKAIRQPTLPTSEDVMTTKEWMRLYSLNKLKLDLNRLVSGPDCRHAEKNVKPLHKNISAKYCNIFPSVNVKGTIKHLQLLPHELVEYEAQVERVLKRYLKRLQWLLSGSHRVFGTVVEKSCVFLIDTSGSMEPYMEELKKELASLIWEQLHNMGARFNLISFANDCVSWRERCQTATAENCHDVIKWSSRLMAGGNTCTLKAIKMAFADPDIEAVYLLTDGKPDTSTSLVLREVSEMNENRRVKINTISFNCEDSTANNFLKLLASETGGRYHRCHGEFDADLFAHKLLSEGFQDTEYPHLPDFEGDDLRRLGEEITLARRFLSQSRNYR
ncbi:von Willebrand factor A domain-containing protein 3A-like [Liolophura sinensis]|uniref:von Willebrand factor A domain-containing protein 3A-like n=1 Tax=Liolophura sinensis TaxID=3198878 RepID=UPI0031595DE4